MERVGSCRVVEGSEDETRRSGVKTQMRREGLDEGGSVVDCCDQGWLLQSLVAGEDECGTFERQSCR